MASTSERSALGARDLVGRVVLDMENGFAKEGPNGARPGKRKFFLDTSAARLQNVLMPQTEKEHLGALLQACEDRLSARLSGIEGRLTNIEARLSNLDATANAISTKVNTIATTLLAPPEVHALGSDGCSPAPRAPMAMAASPKR